MMGGSNQQVAQPVASKGSKKSSPASTQQNPVRIHENQGEIHFHDDKASLKVAVPADQYKQEWNKWKADMSQPLVFNDDDRETIVFITKSSQGTMVDANIDVQKMSKGTNLTILESFI